MKNNIGTERRPSSALEHLRYFSLLIPLAFFILNPVPSVAKNADCDRSCLLKITNDFNVALVKHSPKGLPVSSRLRATQNLQPLPLGEGIWKRASPIRTKLDIADPEAGQVATIGFFYDEGKAAYFVSRLRVTDRKITESEFFYTHRGDTTYFNPKDPDSWDAVYDELVPPGQRASRAELLEIANENIGQLQGEATQKLKHAAVMHGGENGYNMGQATDVERGTGAARPPRQGSGGPGAPGPGGAAPGAGGPPRGPGGSGGPGMAGIHPELLDNSADPSIGKPELPAGRQWMRERRFPLVDTERGLVLSYFLMGGRPPKEGEIIDWDKDYSKPEVVNGVTYTIPNRSTYRIFLIKVAAGELVANAQYEVERPPHVASGF